jgi:hypothetical protein
VRVRMETGVGRQVAVAGVQPISSVRT